jgi:hypothetical protein
MHGKSTAAAMLVMLPSNVLEAAIAFSHAEQDCVQRSKSRASPKTRQKRGSKGQVGTVVCPSGRH